jgi:hypothetical protein
VKGTITKPDRRGRRPTRRASSMMHAKAGRPRGRNLNPGSAPLPVSCLQQPPEFALGHNRAPGIAMIAAMMVRPSTCGDEAENC